MPKSKHSKPLSTGELETQLSRSTSLEAFLRENEENFVDADFSSLLTKLVEEVGVSKAALAKRSGMSEVYLHQLFAGRRRPSRNRLISLCIGMGISLEDCQELLRRCGHAMLYAKSRRDAVIAYGLLNQMDLSKINDMLFDADEETLI